jgi:hypothetical protein
MIHEVLVQKVRVCEDTLVTNRTRVGGGDVLPEEFLLLTRKLTHATGERVYRSPVVIQ